VWEWSVILGATGALVKIGAGHVPREDICAIRMQVALGLDAIDNDVAGPDAVTAELLGKP
jgi:hypothetical protein